MSLAAIIVAVAKDAEASVQSVERRVLGIRVRGRVAARIDRELARRGITPGAPLPAAPSEAPPAA